MLFSIDTHSGVPIYRQVIDQIRRQIVTGLLTPGRQLESVRDLAGRLNINPMTVSKAYSLLEAEGLVERRRGIGLFVSSVERDKAEQVKTEMLDDAISRAAVTAVQLGLTENQAAELFRAHFRHHDSKRRTQ